ncbi:hypothetical protein BVRB_2g040890 [Beta vulgaris subsp. vulgaris]|nr:hypothetical protein BVRB_2g040890 [Beta vulgaris subsp. vulgaris]
MIHVHAIAHLDCTKIEAVLINLFSSFYLFSFIICLEKSTDYKDPS